MPSQRVDQLRPLPHKALMRSKSHGPPLLLGAFDGDEAHAGPGGRFGDSRRIGKIILLALHKGLHMICRDQPHVMTVRHGHTAPVMRRGASLHRDNTRHLIRKQLHQPPTRYRPVEDNDAIRPDAANLKTVLGKVDRQYANPRHGCLPHPGSNKTALALSLIHISEPTRPY